jgi:hypothetical protein
MNAQELEDLPGAELVRRGVADIRAARRTVESLLVTMAAPRLRALGVLERGDATGVQDAELALYELLGDQDTLDPYSRYNALRRELSSFVRALEHRIEKSARRL